MLPRDTPNTHTKPTCPRCGYDVLAATAPVTLRYVRVALEF